MLHDLWNRLRNIVRRDTVERELDEELRHHLEAQVEHYVARGRTREAALRQARVDIGGFDQVKEEHRDARGTRGLEDLWRDARVAVRMLWRAPVFAITVAITVGLGVGVNTLVFSVVQGLVLRPLPIEQPDRVWFVQRRGSYTTHSFPRYRELRDRNRTFAGLAGYRITMMHVETAEGPAHSWGYLATGSYFDVLGITPFRGRLFHQADDVAPGASPYAVLSYDYWRTTFGGDETVIGSTIRINRQPYTVLGVAPPEFHGTEVFYRPAIWVPMMMQAQIEVGNPWLENPSTANTFVIGRLAEGVSPDQAAGDLNTVLRQLADESGTSDDPVAVRLARPGLLGDALGRPARAFGIGLLLLAGLVLLTACANLAAGLAARGADRKRELALRVAIGADRRRLMRQLLTETSVLVGLGGAIGTAAAAVAGAMLSRWQLPVGLPIQLDTSVDWRVAAFAAAATLVTAVGTGVGPALQAVRADPHASLSVRDATVGRGWMFRDVLVSVQVAICVVLVAASLLAGRGLGDALRMPLGLNPTGVMTASFDLGLAGYSRPATEHFRRQLVDGMRGHPGVQQVAYGNSVPLSLDQSMTTVRAVDRPEVTEGEAPRAIRYQVSPAYFETLGVRLIEGRDFSWQDTAEAPAVVVINAALAAHVAADGRVLGRQIHFGRVDRPATIVGVVETGKYQALTEAPTPVVFQPILQSPNTTSVLLVRSTRSDAEMAMALRTAVRELDAALPLIDLRSLEQMLGLVRLPMQAAALALGAFGLLAATLAASGIYGVVAYAVARRTRELAVRVALGAPRRSVVRLVLQRVGVLVALGVVAGVGLVLASRPVFASVLVGTGASSPWSWTLGAGVVVLVSVLACAWPTWRAVRVDPAAVLAAE